MKKETIFRTFSKMPTLQTERLTLRRLSVRDAADMFDYAHRADVTRYLTWSAHPDASYSREYLEYLQGRYAGGMYYDWGIVYKENGKMIGTCGFTSFNCSHDKAEIGYVLHPDYWGKGIAPEAVKKILDFGFEKLNLHRIEANFIKENARSLRVMEKVGMTFEGYAKEAMLIKGNYVTVGTCAVLRSDWEKQQKKK